mgnify:CR=1 FL=1
MMNKLNLNIGYYNREIEVMTGGKTATNSHIALIGASGSGKTVEAQRILCELAKQGQTMLVLSVHGSFSEDQIHPYYKESIDQYRCDVYANKTGIPCRLFDSIKYEDGEVEEIEKTIGAITDIIARTLSLGGRQKNILRIIVENVMETRSYQREGFKAIGDKLISADDKKCNDLYEKGYELFRNSIFYDGDMIQQEKINIIHLERLDLELQRIVTELILAYLWRMGNADTYKKNNIYIFVDECQNMVSDSKGALSQMLSEGRKMGINLLLATQMLLTGTRNAVQQRISQCASILYFKPASDRVKQTAKLISPGNDLRWQFKLKNLKVGEFVATGNYLVGSEAIEYPIIVSANIDMIKEIDHKEDHRNKTRIKYNDEKDV